MTAVLHDPGRAADPAGALGPVRRRAIAAGAVSVALLVAVGALGESASTPPLGGLRPYPPWDAGVRPPAALVGAALVVAYLVGAVAVWWGLRGVSLGWRPRPRRVAAAVGTGVLALVLVPPFGSADHLSYAAYGRIAAQGGDPYLVPPDTWRGGTDPIAAAAEAPWDDTTSVYGPVATALQALTSLVGGESLRLTVWSWQLLAGAAFLLTAWLLDRLARERPERRARVAVLWSGNPLLLGLLVGGAHLDVVSGAAAIACLALGVAAAARRGWASVVLLLAAGVAAGAAAGTKLPYAAAGAAVLWMYRDAGPRRLAGAGVALLAGAAAVLLPGHLWAGPHVYDQARRASEYVSLATPWRGVVNAVDALGYHDVRDVVPFAMALLAVVVLIAVTGLLREADLGTDRVTAGAAALLALGVAYVVASAYVLPWYDALVWAPLALVAGVRGLDEALLIRLTALALAYTPGRVEDSASWLTTALLDLRQFVAPCVTGAVLVWVLARGLPAARRSFTAAVR